MGLGAIIKKIRGRAQGAKKSIPKLNFKTNNIKVIVSIKGVLREKGIKMIMWPAKSKRKLGNCSRRSFKVSPKQWRRIISRRLNLTKEPE